MIVFHTATVFGDSIPRVIRLNEFNSYINKRFAEVKSFPGATSKELLCYIEPILRNIALKCSLFAKKIVRCVATVYGYRFTSIT